MAQPALRRLRSEGGDVNETGVSSQFQLLASERQLTLDGREEPLLSPRAEAVFGSEGERDSKTLPLPLPGVGEQLELREPKWMKACACQAWHLPLRSLKTGKMKRVPWRCRSWRHQGECARWVAKRDFARISEALDGFDPGNIVYVVLTLDQEKEKGTAEQAYQTMWRRWQSLRQWLEREYGKFGYVGTIEQHRTGWPHFNLVLVNHRFAKAIREQTKGKSGVAPSWLKAAAVRAGFGYRAWAQAPRDVRELSGYIVKLAHRESLTGEVTKLTQLPLRAPAGTRRLRSSRCFLAPTYKSSGEWTGQLVRHSVAEAERLEAEHQARAQEHWAQTERWMKAEVRRQWGVPQRDPKGADGAAKPARGEGGTPAGPGAEPRLVTTGTSHSLEVARELAEPEPLPLEALAGADPPDGGSSALSCIASSVITVDDATAEPRFVRHTCSLQTLHT